MRDFDEVRETMDRHQDRILSAISNARDELFDIPEELDSNLRSALDQAEYYAEDLVSYVNDAENEFEVGGITQFTMPATIHVTWDRDSGEINSASIAVDRSFSPSTVITEDGEEIAAADSQCYAWQSELRNLDGESIR